MDWLPELADDDFATLLEALEAWEVKDAAAGLLPEMLEALFADRGDPRGREAFRQQVAHDKQKRAQEAALRKERSVLLRAKLLTLRDRRRVEREIEKPL